MRPQAVLLGVLASASLAVGVAASDEPRFVFELEGGPV